jgi:hypothetical protein
VTTTTTTTTMLQAVNATSATIKAGDTGVNFPITLPLWTGGLSSQNEQCTGQIKSLTFTDTVDRAQPLRLGMWFASDYGREAVYPFRLQTTSPVGNKMKAVGDKLWTHYGKAREFWPLQLAVPRLQYVSVEVEPDDPHWELTLPPFTSMYSSYEYFFPTLGFNGGSLSDAEEDVAPEQESQTRVVGGRQSMRVQTTVYGFFNDTEDTRGYRGITTYPGISLNEVLWELEGADEQTDWPGYVQLQKEFGEMELRKVQLPHPPRPFNREEVVSGVTLLLEMVRRELGIKSLQIDVGVAPVNAFTLSTRPIPDSKLTIVLGWDTATSAAFGVSKMTQMYFNLAYHRVFATEVRAGGKINPFEGKTPVLILGYGGPGPARSWVEGRGFATVMGIIEEDEQITWVADTEFNTNNRQLSLDFQDLELKPHSFVSPLHAHLVMSFTKPSTTAAAGSGN